MARWVRVVSTVEDSFDDGQVRRGELQPFITYYWNVDDGTLSHTAPAVNVDWELRDNANGNRAFHNASLGVSCWSLPTYPNGLLVSDSWSSLFQTVLCTQSVCRIAGSAKPPPKQPRSAVSRDDLAGGVWVDVNLKNREWYWVLLRGGRIAQTCHKPQEVRCKWCRHETDNGCSYYEDLESGSVHATLPSSSSLDDVLPRWFEVGAAVEIQGLEQDRHFEGARGCLHQLLPGGRVVVGFAKCLERHESVPAGCVRPLCRGARVEIHSVTSKPGLNGQIGTVEDYVVTDSVPSTLKYLVHLPGGRALKLFATKLKPVTGLEDLTLSNTATSLVWKKTEQQCRFSGPKGEHFEYHIQFPLNFEEEREKGLTPKWPLLVWLHGAGSGTFFSQMKRTIGKLGTQYAAEHFVVVSPTCGWTWKQTPHPWVLDLVEALRTASWVDHTRVYLSGVSMGGMGTWELAAQRPNLFAAVAPVAAHHKADRRATIAKQLQNVPILALHSVPDGTCKLSEEIALWSQLLREGAVNLQVELSASLDHMDMFEAAFCDDIFLYHWLLMFSLSE